MNKQQNLLSPIVVVLKKNAVVGQQTRHGCHLPKDEQSGPSSVLRQETKGDPADSKLNLCSHIDNGN